jgi:hypothetical protein
MRIIVLLAAAFSLAGCATQEPIRDVVASPVGTPADPDLSMGEVRTAIERAGRSLGWQMFAEQPGTLSGRLALRSHVAVVEIEFDTAHYSIRYRESTNLDAADGHIHEAYNEWVEKLDRAIRAELERPRQR